MGGMVLETNLSHILTAITDQNKLQSGNTLTTSSSVTSSTTSTLGLASVTVAGKLFSSLSGISGS